MYARNFTWNRKKTTQSAEKTKLLDGVQTCIELADEQEWTGKWGTSFEGGPEKVGSFQKKKNEMI